MRLAVQGHHVAPAVLNRVLHSIVERDIGGKSASAESPK